MAADPKQTTLFHLPGFGEADPFNRRVFDTAFGTSSGRFPGDIERESKLEQIRLATLQREAAKKQLKIPGLQHLNLGFRYPQFEPGIYETLHIPESDFVSREELSEAGRLFGNRENTTAQVITKKSSTIFSSLSKKAKWAIGLGAAGAAGLLAYNLFTAKDDAYNSIEGLPHGGLGQQYRQFITPFGSGWQGEDYDYLDTGLSAAGIGIAGYLGLQTYDTFRNYRHDPSSKRILAIAESVRGTRGHIAPSEAIRDWLKPHGWDVDIVTTEELERLDLLKNKPYRAFMDAGFHTPWISGLPGIAMQWDVQGQRDIRAGAFRHHLRPGLGIEAPGIAFGTITQEAAEGFAQATGQRNFYSLGNFALRPGVITKVQEAVEKAKAGTLNLPGIKQGEKFITISGGGSGIGVAEAVRVLEETKWLEETNHRAVVFAANMESGRPEQYRSLMETIRGNPSRYIVFDMDPKGPGRRLPEYMAGATANLLAPGASTTAEAMISQRPFIGFHGGGMHEETYFTEHIKYARKQGAVARSVRTPNLGASVKESASRMRSALESVILESNRAAPRVFSHADFDVGKRFISIIEQAERAGHMTPRSFRFGLQGLLSPIIQNKRIRTAGIIGAGVAAIAGIKYLFSGKDDDYNIIEGLPHGGLAEQLRKQNTDFGSGYKGQFFKRVGNWIASKVGNLTKGRQQTLSLSEPIISVPATNQAIQPVESALSATQSLQEPQRWWEKGKFGWITSESGSAYLASGALAVVAWQYEDSLGSGYSVLSGAQAGAALGYWKSGRKGSMIGVGLGGLVGYGLSKVSDETLGTPGKVIVSSTLGSISSSLLSLGSMKGGILYNTMLKGAEAIARGTAKDKSAAGIRKAVEDMMIPQGYDPYGPRGFATLFSQTIFNAANWFRKVQANPSEVSGLIGFAVNNPASKHGFVNPFLKFTDFFKNHPRVTGFIDATLGSPRLIETVTKYGGPDKVPAQAMRNALGLDILQGLPVGLAVGVFSGSYDYYKKQKRKRNQASNSIPGSDDSYNTIEGLPHGGLSEQLRKENTAFGSGFDRVRELAKLMGKSFEEVIGSSAFKEAIAAGKVVERLGGGRFGEAHLMETMFHGERLSFVRKTVLGRQADETMEQFILRQYDRGFDLTNEAKLMSRFGESSFAPSVYSATPGEMFMEHMPGQTLGKHLKLPAELQPQVENILGELHRAGVVHGDVAGRNILFDPESGRLSLIDFGRAREATGRDTVQEMFQAAKSVPAKGLRKKAVQQLVASPSSEEDIFTSAREVAPLGPITGNTIEGLPHGGQAEISRRTHTDFKSPWGGLWKSVSEGVSKTITKVGGLFARDPAKMSVSRWAKKLASSSERLHPGEVYDLLTAHPSMRQSLLSGAAKPGASTELKATWGERMYKGVMEKHAEKLRNIPNFWQWQHGEKWIDAPAGEVVHKVYATLSDPARQLTSENLDRLLARLEERGAKGVSKVFFSPDSAVSRFESITSHAHTAEDADLIADTIRSVFGKQTKIHRATELSKGRSASQELAEDIIEKRAARGLPMAAVEESLMEHKAQRALVASAPRLRESQKVLALNSTEAGNKHTSYTSNRRA